MTSRERVRAVFEGRKPDRPPFNFWMDRDAMERLDALLGEDFRVSHYGADVIEAFAMADMCPSRKAEYISDGKTMWMTRGKVDDIEEASGLPVCSPEDPAIYGDIEQKRRKYPQKAIFAMVPNPLGVLNSLLLPTIPLEPVSAERLNKRKKNDLKQQLKEEAVKLYESKEAEFPETETIRELERVILLKVIDRKWMDHIDDMEQLRQGIGLQAYGQRDPLVEYKMAGYDMFDEMTQNIREETVRLLFHVKVEQKVEREDVAKVTGTIIDDSSVKRAPKKRESVKVYPNDPCPCGSGLKYKNCCGRKG